MAEVSKGFAPLEERIRKEGRVLPGNIIKIDGFLNHRVDMQLMHELSHEFIRRFDTLRQEGQVRQHRGRPLPERDHVLYL